VILMEYIRNDKFKDEFKKLESMYLFPLGDVHYGSSTSNYKEFEKYLELGSSLDNAYFIFMGDLMESAGRTSPGMSQFTQDILPQEQYNWVIETLTPVKHKALVFHGANHERRVQISTGIDISKNQAHELGIRYVPFSSIMRIKLKKCAYNIHSMHGSAGSTLSHTKIKAHKDATAHIEGVDIYLMGHVHFNHTEEIIIRRPNIKEKRIDKIKIYKIMTGHFLEWDNSYAEEKSYNPLPLGAPIIKLNGLEREIKVMSIEDFK